MKRLALALAVIGSTGSLRAAPAAGDPATISPPGDAPVVPAGQERTLRVWAPANQNWTTSRDGEVVTLKPAAAAGDDAGTGEGDEATDDPRGRRDEDGPEGPAPV